MNQILAITRKELKAYFGSPMAAIFIGAFLLVVLFSFFWVETFFARNIADIRPLFQWMPVLMIFLVAALTMRQWSEEQKMGTLEVLLTLPVKISRLVLGKFLAVLALVAIALLLTAGLPISVAILGNIDWGPVIGGYLGALLMAAAYISVGLFISARTDNQIIALILTVFFGGLFYLVGANGFTAFFGNDAAAVLRSIGTGSRFMSIERGVIDLRDLFYYASITTFFLALNVLSLDAKSWSKGSDTACYRRNRCIAVILLAANLLAANMWMAKIANARLDLTENKIYSISHTTRDLLDNLNEPLIMRGYFSAKTHPLLSPLVPAIKDLIDEYRLASHGKVEISFVDPRDDEEMEAEANQQYGIKPVPFQVAGRYESSVVNSYFNILIKYGDQYTVLGFNDIIEVEQHGGGGIEVRLRNLEYDLTKSIKKVVYGFQGIGQLFASIHSDVKLTLVCTPNRLPEPLAGLNKDIIAAAGELEKEAGGKFTFDFVDPDADGVTPQDVKKVYDIDPIALSIFSNDTFYLNLLLNIGGNVEPIFVSEGMGKAEIRNEIAAALKRNGSGFVKTVGVWIPESSQVSSQTHQSGQGSGSYQIFQQLVRENYNLQLLDLDDGRIPADVDVLMVVAPHDLSDLERFSVDQYLMRGGSVIVLNSQFLLDLTPSSASLNIKKIKNGLLDMLVSYGIKQEASLVMDKMNEPFPVPVTRNLGGFMVQEIRQLDYPYFIDIRRDGMDKTNPIVASLPAVTMNWASPLNIDADLSGDHRVDILLQSSPDSWLSDETDIQPDFSRYPALGFAVGKTGLRYPLAVAVQGQFKSFFADKPDPRSRAGEGIDSDTGDTSGNSGQRPALQLPVISSSPKSSRLVVVGSSEFINDTVISISQSTGRERYINTLEFVQNMIDWAVADEDLLAIRSRGTHSRILPPLTNGQQSFWEWLNYALALLGLAIISLLGVLKVRQEKAISL